MLFFDRPKPIDYSAILPILERADPEEMEQLLWHPRHKRINYLPITISLLQKLKKGEDSHLEIHKVISKGMFELAIFKLPWSNAANPYSPLIFEKTSKVVGVMLPFNELHGVISKKQSSQIGDLGVAWVSFAMSHNVK
jgi:hypothetical protein